jgi:transcription elongation factor GreA
MEKVPMTKAGYDALEEELKDLKSRQRPEVIEAIATAREHGDLSENAEYHAAREQQSFIEGRIQELESVIGSADIIDPSTLSGDTVKFGATVKIIDEDTEEERIVQIVGPYETDAEKGKISVTSPIAKALIGKSEGDSAEVSTPGGVRTYEIEELRYA